VQPRVRRVESQGEQLMPETYPKIGSPEADELPEHRDGERRWLPTVAGTLDRKIPSGPQREDRRGRAACRDHGDSAAEAQQAARDVVFDAVVHANDVEIRE